MALYRNALTFVLTSEAIPVIYYGSEQAFATGGSDNANRAPLWHSGYNTTHPIYQFISHLNGRRIRGDFDGPQREIWVSDSTYAFTRGSRILVITTNVGGGNSASIDIPLYKLPPDFQPGLKVCSIIDIPRTGDKATVSSVVTETAALDKANTEGADYQQGGTWTDSLEDRMAEHQREAAASNGSSWFLDNTLSRLPTAEMCALTGDDRRDCGTFGTNRRECEANGCCWMPTHEGSASPWCFFPSSEMPSIQRGRQLNQHEGEPAAAQAQTNLVRGLPEPVIPFPPARCGSEHVTEKVPCGKPDGSTADCRDAGCCYVPTAESGDPWCYYAVAVPGGDASMCDVSGESRRPCGDMHLATAAQCAAQGCCFRPTATKGVPWCFRPTYMAGDDFWPRTQSECAAPEDIRHPCGAPDATREECIAHGCCYSKTSRSFLKSCFQPFGPPRHSDTAVDELEDSRPLPGRLYQAPLADAEGPQCFVVGDEGLGVVIPDGEPMVLRLQVDMDHGGGQASST
mmetsp:Transcript_4502/g.11937  ORF Transcript_4502/g.11937 Transcript_4502/m.11937 type:complete len:514 (-) Transcript_4502:31-1572(-)